MFKFDKFTKYVKVHHNVLKSGLDDRLRAINRMMEMLDESYKSEYCDENDLENYISLSKDVIEILVNQCLDINKVIHELHTMPEE